MQEKLSGIVASAEVYKPKVEPLRPGIILRFEECYEPIVVGEDVRLVLVNGNTYQTKVIGLTLGEAPGGVLVVEIQDVPSGNLVGARLYVFAK